MKVTISNAGDTTVYCKSGSTETSLKAGESVTFDKPQTIELSEQASQTLLPRSGRGLGTALDLEA